MADIKFSEWAGLLAGREIQNVTGDELLVCIDDEGTPMAIAQGSIRTGGRIIEASENTSANHATGTIYTDAGSSGTVTVTFEDSPLNTEYTFFVTDNAIQLDLTGTGHTIQFWDGSNSRDTPYVLLGSPGKSITIKKITSTKWAAIAVNGAVDND